MSRDRINQPTELSRRAFLAGTGGAIAGAASYGLAGKAEAGEPKPGRGGRFVLPPGPMPRDSTLTAIPCTTSPFPLPSQHRA
jgi:hypothetical protein